MARSSITGGRRSSGGGSGGGVTGGTGGAVRITQGKNKADQKYNSAKEKDRKAESDVLRMKLRLRSTPGDAGIKQSVAKSIKVSERSAKALKKASTPSSKMKSKKDAPRNAKKAGM